MEVVGLFRQQLWCKWMAGTLQLGKSHHKREYPSPLYLFSQPAWLRRPMATIVLYRSAFGRDRRADCVHDGLLDLPLAPTKTRSRWWGARDWWVLARYHCDLAWWSTGRHCMPSARVVTFGCTWYPEELYSSGTVDGYPTSRHWAGRWWSGPVSQAAAVSVHKPRQHQCSVAAPHRRLWITLARLTNRSAHRIAYLLAFPSHWGVRSRRPIFHLPRYLLARFRQFTPRLSWTNLWTGSWSIFLLRLTPSMSIRQHCQSSCVPCVPLEQRTFLLQPVMRSHELNMRLWMEETADATLGSTPCHHRLACNSLGLLPRPLLTVS